MKCTNCNAELNPGEMFCGECGRHVQTVAVPPPPAPTPGARRCPNCGDDVATGKRFCGSCGHDLTAAPTTPRAEATRAAAPEVRQASASTPPSSTRIALIVGIAAAAAILLLGAAGVGLWLWSGRGSEVANQTTAPRVTPSASPANANARVTSVSIAGTWNCEFRSSTEIERGQMVLAQNGSAVTGTVVTDDGRIDQLAGTFDGQKFSFKIPGTDFEWQLPLSPDGSTMKAEAEYEGEKGTLFCSR